MPLCMPRRGKLLTIHGEINSKPVQYLLGTACWTQLCDFRIDAKYLAPARLEDTWYIESHQQGALVPVTECARVRLDLGGHLEDLDSVIADLQGFDMFLGLPWPGHHKFMLDFLC